MKASEILKSLEERDRDLKMKVFLCRRGEEYIDCTREFFELVRRRRWQSDVKGLLDVAGSIAEKPLEANGLPSKRLAPVDDTTVGFTHMLGYAGIYVEKHGGTGYAYVSLLYGELCRRGLFPPRYAASLSIQFEESSPFGRERWLLVATAAYFDRLVECLLEEYERWAEFRGGVGSFVEFRARLEEEWLEGLGLNVLSGEKLEVLRELAPSTYRHLSLALKATNSVKLWVRRDLDVALLAGILDVTEMNEGEVAQLVPRLLEEVSASQQKLQEAYLEEAQKALRHTYPGHVIRVKSDPCRSKCYRVGPWIIAKWS